MLRPALVHDNARNLVVCGGGHGLTHKLLNQGWQLLAVLHLYREDWVAQVFGFEVVSFFAPMIFAIASSVFLPRVLEILAITS